jgi:hypothetical protein
MPIHLPPVTVHSVAEAYLYLMTLHCPTCGRGPVRETGELTRHQEAEGGWTLDASCGTCKSSCTVHFQINPMPTREEAQSGRINTTSQRSQAIDLLGWLTLFQNILTASQMQENRQTGRELAHEAAQCLDEAMKFYDADNELPGEDAFFTDESLRRYREQPQHFSRSKWRERRMKLPDATVKTQGARKSNPRWWQFWRSTSD